MEEGLSYGLFPELGFEEIKAWNSTGETITPLYPTSYREVANPTSNLAGKRIPPPFVPHTSAMFPKAREVFLSAGYSLGPEEQAPP